jgi:8-oxo-dGTP pyrophosphatase MutT (NUDIX family)
VNHSFNVRVYGILINEKDEILLSDEYIKGNAITKFPGGGLEYGEGTLDCLKREWREELEQDIEVKEPIYTTDFFQISAFGDGRQIISIYYSVKTVSPFVKTVKLKPFDFDELVDQAQALRWMPVNELTEDAVTLPIDKIVVGIIKNKQPHHPTH